MTWKEIKEKIEELGVKDEDLVMYIDISSLIFSIESYENKGWEIIDF